MVPPHLAFSVTRNCHLFEVAIAALVAHSLVTQPLNAQSNANFGNVRISGPGSLDWGYVVNGHSQAGTTEKQLPDYSWEGQSYDFFHPNISADGASLPLVIYFSPSNRSKGWHFWEALCHRHGVMYASPRKAGNSVGLAHRIRIALDVLEEIRRKYHVDPDRTYLVGLSGGAMVAQRVAFRLPEYFGGVLCAGQMIGLPRDASLRHRTRDRLSVALICGERDPIAPLVEFRDAHLLRGFGYRCELKIVRRLGHTMPPTEVLEQAFLWMEEGVAQRRQLAAQYPMSSISQTPPRADWAEGLLAEAESRFANTNETYRAVALCENIANRWPDLPEAIQAKALIETKKNDVQAAWQAQLAAEKHLIARLQAEGMQRLASAPARGFVRNQQGAIALEAVAHWERLLAESTDEAERQAITSKIKQLREEAQQTAAQHGIKPLQATRFRLVGEVTVQQGLDRLSTALAKLGYELVITEEAFPNYAQVVKETRYLQLPAATAEQALQVLLAEDKVKLHRRGRQLHAKPK